MILDITRSNLFTKDPAERFAKVNSVSPKLFNELWRRHTQLEYSIPELCMYFHIKVGVPISDRKMNEWIFRNRIYMRAQSALKVGAKAVNSDYFGDLEERLLRKLTEHMKYRETKSLRVMI
jgi:hypothetical protein